MGETEEGSKPEKSKGPKEPKEAKVARTKQRKQIHFGYLVVAAMVLTSFIPLSLALSCAGIFYPSLSASLGVEKGALSYYTTFIWVAALVSLPALGRLLSKVDARVCLTGAVALISVAFVWLSFLTYLWQFYAAALAMGVGIAMLLFLAPSTLINRWFSKRAGAMLGIAMAFTGVGGAVFSSVGGMLIDNLGWSATYRAFAVLSACTIPATLLMVRSRPSDLGLQPVGWVAEKAFEEDGGNESRSNADAENHAARQTNDEQPSASPDAQPVHAHVAAKTEGTSAKEAYRSPTFFLICAMCFFLNIGMYVYFMIPSYATTLAVGLVFPLLGATASSLAMVGQTASKLALGAVGERFPHASTIAALCLGMAGIGAFAFFAESVPAYYAAALSFGFYYGITNVMMPIFTRRCFGDKDYAAIYAKVSMVASISNALAALIWGTVIDATGSYLPMFAGVAALMALTIATVLAIRRRLGTGYR